jgi:D-beta-D-heptose 7-phosphate kinase/D-beta-D-heptose 1-phosphate adenosyltransferase
MKVLLIGDTCEDRYFYGDVKRLNPEAPVPILEYRRGVTSKGMAWNVRENLMSFGVEVYISTHPEEIIKTRYIDEKSNQQIMRYDEEPEITPISFEFPDEWKTTYDALVISDYDKGFITQEKLFELSNWFQGPVFIDTKKICIPGNAFIKVNESEFKKITHFIPDNMIITKGGEGTEYQGKLYPAEKVNVFDVVGAGDTFLAALTYGYLKYGRIEEAIPLANKAAAVAVSHRGTYVLTEEDINEILH